MLHRRRVLDRASNVDILVTKEKHGDRYYEIVNGDVEAVARRLAADRLAEGWFYDDADADALAMTVLSQKPNAVFQWLWARRSNEYEGIERAAVTRAKGLDHG